MPVSRGLFAIISASDIDLVRRYRWSVSSSGYVHRSQKKNRESTRIALHRAIIGARTEELVDHINGNPLDNRRENLRIANPSQNSWNTAKRKDSKNLYKGVRRNRDKFSAFITVRGNRMHIGVYDTQEEAHAAYCDEARRHFGEFARTE
jgi:hypothetical protein